MTARMSAESDFRRRVIRPDVVKVMRAYRRFECSLEAGRRRAACGRGGRCSMHPRRRARLPHAARSLCAPSTPIHCARAATTHCQSCSDRAAATEGRLLLSIPLIFRHFFSAFFHFRTLSLFFIYYLTHLNLDSERLIALVQYIVYVGF